MRFIGYASVLLLLLLGQFVFFLYMTGRLQKNELDLFVQEMIALPPSEDSETDQISNEPMDFDERLEQRSLSDRRASRENESIQALQDAAEQKQQAADSQLQLLQQAKDDLVKSQDDEIEVLRKQGQQKVLTLLESMQPVKSKDFLISLDDENESIDYLKQLDPITAAKIIKEFVQPDDIRKLNRWLQLLGQGEPDVTKTRTLIQNQIASVSQLDNN